MVTRERLIGYMKGPRSRRSSRQHGRGLLLGTALYVATIALFAFAIGALLRNSAAAVATVLGVLLVLPIVFGLVP